MLRIVVSCAAYSVLKAYITKDCPPSHPPPLVAMRRTNVMSSSVLCRMLCFKDIYYRRFSPTTPPSPLVAVRGTDATNRSVLCSLLRVKSIYYREYFHLKPDSGRTDVMGSSGLCFIPCMRYIYYRAFPPGICPQVAMTRSNVMNSSVLCSILCEKGIYFNSRQHQPPSACRENLYSEV